MIKNNDIGIGPGRPKSENPKNRSLQIRLCEDDFIKLGEMAEKANMTISAFARANLISWIHQD
jgi:hypothetical protein